PRAPSYPYLQRRPPGRACARLPVRPAAVRGAALSACARGAQRLRAARCEGWKDAVRGTRACIRQLATTERPDSPHEPDLRQLLRGDAAQGTRGTVRKRGNDGEWSVCREP